jgi:hypothetical protein
MKKIDLPNTFITHLLSIILFILVSIVISWPTVDNFSTRLVGNTTDTLANVWGGWFYKKAIFGTISIDPITILFYPKGVPLSVMGGGPLSGLFSIPFLGMGYYETYNGGFLLAMVATGYCMFLLARSLGMDKIPSIFAGIALEISPLILIGLVIGHPIKAFQGNLALYLLFLNQLAVDRSHMKRNIILGALSMLFCLLYDANYFIFAVIATVVFVAVKLLQNNAISRITLIKRLAVLTLVSAAICSPYLFKLAAGYGSSSFNVKLSNLASSTSYSTDLAGYFLPNGYNTLFGQFSRNLVDTNPGFAPEVGVTIPLSLFILSIIGIFKFGKKNLFFYLVFLTFFLLAMGPYIHFLGNRIEINGNPVYLPFYYLTMIPGFDFIRVPSRFMMMGYIGLGITAALGLDFLTRRYQNMGLVLSGILLATLVAESWWVPFASSELPDVPRYYVEMGENSEEFGVLDLPMTLPGVGEAAYDFSTFTTDTYVNYMLFQMTHNKGIAAGYVARSYLNNPIIETMDSKHSGLFSPPEMTLAGERPAKFSNLQFELGQLNYRKVVWHKELFGTDYCRKPDSIAFVIGHGLCYEAVETQEKEITSFLEQAFGSREPEFDDGRMIVYDVKPYAESDLIPNLQYDANWPEKIGDQQPVPVSAGIITEFPDDVTLRMKIIFSSRDGGQIEGRGRVRFLIDGEVIGESEILPIVELNVEIPKGKGRLIFETNPSSDGQASLDEELFVQELSFSYLEN